MDLRTTDDEIVAVSEAPEDHGAGARISHPRAACVHIVDLETRRLRERFEVSDATINCCDVGRGFVCLGSDDAKVRLYSREGAASASTSGHYRRAYEFACASEVNDLRFAREDAVLAVRTHQNRHPAGLDLIPLARPDARSSFPGGSWATRGKFIHALDGFEECCTLSSVACSGEHPLTSAFSAMLFDFRLVTPCVVDVPVTSGEPAGTMLWPLRAGRDFKVYANLLHEEDGRRGQGTIAMVDFRYPSEDVCTRFRLPDPVDDFRCFGGKLYAACTDASCDSASQRRMRIVRCDPSLSQDSAPECLSTIVQAYDPGGRSPREDLKVFSISQRGFATSYGENLALGTIAEPPSC